MATMFPAYRRGAPGDLPAIAAIQDSVPEAAHWNPADYLEHDLWVAEPASATLAAFVVIRHLAPGECEILNLAVAPAFRRKHIASALFSTALRGFLGDVFLEVRESNHAAQKFYKSLGFQAVSTRADYYSAPAEAAIVMKFHSC